jgi:acetyltransferase-like isoleucine patch superfamily enzyme
MTRFFRFPQNRQSKAVWGIFLFPHTKIQKIYNIDNQRVRFILVILRLPLIRSGAKISVGEKGTLTIGNNFKASAENKFICYKAVTLGDNVSMGWESMLMDTNFHQTLDSNGNPHGRPYAPISIGDYCWLGFRTVCMPNTRIPNKCILASNSLANKNYDIEEYSLLAGSPAKVKATGIWRDPANDKVIFIL